MEFENLNEVMEELLELEISKLFSSVEGVTEVIIHDITIKESVHDLIWLDVFVKCVGYIMLYVMIYPIWYSLYDIDYII